MSNYDGPLIQIPIATLDNLSAKLDVVERYYREKARMTCSDDKCTSEIAMIHNLIIDAKVMGEILKNDGVTTPLRESPRL